jgi:hypothetical protein
MNMIMNRYLCGILGCLATSFSAASSAGEPRQGVVVAVDSEQSTRAYVANHGLPAGQAEGGRFAVVRLINGEAGNAPAYAVAYVPARLSVAQNDQVELEPTDNGAVAKPGAAVVTRISHVD